VSKISKSKDLQRFAIIGIIILVSITFAFTQTVLGSQESLFSWSGILPANPSLSVGKHESYSAYLCTSEQVVISLSAPETVEIFVQSSADYSKSSGNGWWIVYYEYKTETADLTYTYTIPYTDTWYFTIRNLKHNDVTVNTFEGNKVVADPTSTPTQIPITPTQIPNTPIQVNDPSILSNSNLVILLIGSILGAVIASVIVAFYFVKIRKEPSQ
jgi:hypothetical protein